MKIASPLTTEPSPVLQWIEVASSLQIPNFHIIGLPSPEVAEARERVRAAIDASDFEFPRRRVVLNLSPASIRKRGTGSDLAMALAILAKSQEQEMTYEPVVASGELGLDGRIKPVGQAMRTLYASWEAAVPRVLLALEDFHAAQSYLSLLRAAEDFKTSPPRLIPVSNLQEAWKAFAQPDWTPQSHLPADDSMNLLEKSGPCEPMRNSLLPLSPGLERIIMTAAAGRHHLLILGPRGVGKSHALEWFTRLLPPASPKTRVHHLLIQELSGALAKPLNSHAPIRRIGSQVRPAALTGGTFNSTLKPGEFSLAHGGVLIADELPEWPRDSRETFREPLERGSITLTRASMNTEMPAQFTLVANGNLCPCGGWPKNMPNSDFSGIGNKTSTYFCFCDSTSIRKYFERLSGPILDRIDLIALVTQVKRPEGNITEALPRLKNQIARAREVSISLWGEASGVLSAPRLEEILGERAAWRNALDKMSLISLRSRHKVLRVGLTLAILDYVQGREATPEARIHHLEEASFFRPEAHNLHLRQ